MSKLRVLGILLLSTFPTLVEGTVLPRPRYVVAQQRTRPKIGLALSGGGAKGCAHIGVLEELERLHIPIDYITGTSMGAIVGGLYASGMPLDEMKRVVAETDWDDLLNDRTPYRNLIARRKQERAQYPIELDAGWKDNRVVFPAGVQPGQKLGILLKYLLLPVAYERDFSRLPIPFKAVATDLETGRSVILDRGKVAEAIRASMSIPGVFTPVQWGDDVLIDGGLADNLPIDLVRSMGADIVIAVDLAQQNADRRQLLSLLSIIGQTINFQTRNNVIPQLKHADIVITPAVQSYGVLQFDEALHIIELGRRAARANEAALSAHTADDATWNAYVARRVSPPLNDQRVAYVRIEGTNLVDLRRIEPRMKTREGETLDVMQLERDVRAIYAMEEFDRIDVSLTENEPDSPEGRGVVMRIREKPWGPTYLHSRLEIDDAFDGSASLTFGAGLTRRGLNRRGGELHVDALVGTRQGVTIELHQPLDFDRGYFVETSVRYEREVQTLFDGRARMASYSVNEERVMLDFGRALSTIGMLRVGASTGRIRAGVRTGLNTLPMRSANTGDVHTSVYLDATDHPFIPRNGSRFIAELSSSMPELGADTRYSQASARLLHARSFGAYTAFVGGDVGSRLSGTLPIYDQYTAGGFLSLGGYASGQLRGDSLAVSRVGALRYLGKPAAPIGRGLYAGALVEAGNVWHRLGDASSSDLAIGTTLFLAFDTLVGPLYAAVSAAEGQGVTPYLAIGQRF